MNSTIQLLDYHYDIRNLQWKDALILLALLSFLLVVFNVAEQLAKAQVPSSLPPVVFHWVPFFGSAISYGNDPLNFFIKCRQKYGDVFTMVLFGRRITVALGVGGNHFVLGGKSTVFNAEDAYKHLTTPVFGKDVVYDVPNHIFMEQKKFLKFGLNTSNFRVYIDMIEDEVHQYLHSDPKLQKNGSKEWGTFDALKVMGEITILTAARTLQGKEVRNNLDKTFADLYKDLDGGFTPLNFLFPGLPLESNRRRDRAQKRLSEFFIKIIQRRKANFTNEEIDMISSLLGQRYRDGRLLQDHEIAHMMIGLLMAGQHTSSSTGSWVLLHLATAPSIAEALYSEQVEFFSNAAGSLRPMTYDELRQLPLLNAVISETLRIHPPIHSIMRYVREDVPVPSSLSLPPGSPEIIERSLIVPRGHYVLASPVVSQMDHRIWESPEVWDPYRWVNPQSQTAPSSFSKATESVFQPFGSGKHRCIGEQFAYLQLGTIIATIIRHMELHKATGMPKPDYQTMITRPKEPRLIQYCRRNRN